MRARVSAVERFLALGDGTEIWWDTSPLVYEPWRQATVGAAPDPEERAAQLDRLWNPLRPADGLLSGSTTNPPLVWQAIAADRQTWDGYARAEAASAGDARELFWRVYGEVCRRGARLLMPAHEASGGRRGRICAQVDPRDLTRLDAMLPQARRLHALSPNIVVKMPATSEGIEGIRILTAEGISTAATLCFSVAQLAAVAEAARAGLRAAREAGADVGGVRSYAALMMGRMEEVPLFRQQADAAGVEIGEEELRWAGVAVARRAHALFRRRGYETTLILASMRPGPTVADEPYIWHLEQLAGADAVFTLFPNILAEFLTHYQDRPLERLIDEPLPGEALERLRRVPYFRQAYEEGALAPEEFAALPGVQATGAQFIAAMQRIEAYARDRYAEATGEPAHLE